MSTRNKKSSLSIPFTQLWYNFSSDSTKGTKKQHNNKNSQKQNFSSDLYPKPRRSSISYLSKRPQISTNNGNQRISMILLQGRDKCIDDLRNGQSLDEDSIYQVEKNKSDHSQKGKKVSQRGKDTERVSEKVLKIIELNVIPFLVDKFVEVEEKMTKQLEKLQTIVRTQSKQIDSMKKNQQLLKDQLMKIDKIDKNEQNCQQSLLNKENISLNGSLCKCQVPQTCFPVSSRNSPAKLVQTQQRPLAKDPENKKSISKFLSNSNNQTTKHNQQRNKIKTILTEQSEMSDGNMKQISLVLEELTNAMQQSGIRNNQQFCNLEKQVKKIGDRQKIGEEKLEKQFAQRILELITTYNDNFVDLDKRIESVQGVVLQKSAPKMLKKSAPKTIDFSSDNPKTNRYE